MKQKTRRLRLGCAFVVIGVAILTGSLPTGMASATVAAIVAQDSRSTIELAVASTNGEGSGTDWKVQAGRAFQRAGEYTVRRSLSYDSPQHTRLQNAIDAYGPPSSCKISYSRSYMVSYAVVTWATRGIRIYSADGGPLPAGETACTSPDLVYVYEIRLTDRRWTTSFGLHVGDPTTKLRRLYPRAP
jgi:hypothetical protein